MKFKQNRQTLIISKKTQKTDTKQNRVDVILTPSFYWVKKLSLPVDSIKQAKKLLPGIFEECLPDGDFSYYVYKKENEFIAFAYNDDEIIKKLKELGIYDKTDSVRFFQSEFENEEDDFLIDGSCLKKENGIYVELSEKFCQNPKSTTLPQKLSKHKIDLEIYKSFIDKSTLYKVVGIIALFLLLNIIQTVVISSKISKLEKEKEKIFQKYSLLPSSFQNRAILKKWKKTDKKQIKIRNILKNVLTKTKNISSVKVENKKITILYEDIKNKQNILSKLAYKPDKTSFKNSKLLLEFDI